MIFECFIIYFIKLSNINNLLVKLFMGIGDWGLGIGGLGLGAQPQNPKPQPPTPNPKKIF